LNYLANTQTDRQTNKVWQKHYLLGGGKNKNLGNINAVVVWLSVTSLDARMKLINASPVSTWTGYHQQTDKLSWHLIGQPDHYGSSHYE